MRRYRQEWIAALESGRFPQSFNTWFDGEKRCAMGVGIEVLRGHDALPDRLKSALVGINAQHSTQLLGITPRQEGLIVAMNDRLHLSHPEIARILRQLDRRDALIAAEHDPAAWEARKPAERLVGEASPRD
jgi:hypothetical protein